MWPTEAKKSGGKPNQSTQKQLLLRSRVLSSNRHASKPPMHVGWEGALIGVVELTKKPEELSRRQRKRHMKLLSRKDEFSGGRCSGL